MANQKNTQRPNRNAPARPPAAKQKPKAATLPPPKVVAPAVDPGGLDDLADLDVEGDSLPGTRRTATVGRRRTATTNRWMRWAHVYLSMISFVVILFFGITGLTLDHPTWTLGGSTTHTLEQGTLPAGWNKGGTVQWLTISEFVRDKYSVTGHITSFGAQATTGTINYNSAGYAAAFTFDTNTGAYKLDIEEDPFIAVMNDLHKGRDTTTSWKWVIDLSAIFLVLVSLSGLGIQLFQRKRRTRAIVFAAAGAVVTILFVYIATR